MRCPQPGILAPVPAMSRYPSFVAFVAFGVSFDAFEAQRRRMVGLDDGIDDALFRFTRPVSGASFRCPPQAAGRVDLSLLGP